MNLTLFPESVLEITENRRVMIPTHFIIFSFVSSLLELSYSSPKPSHTPHSLH
jgi:hypothetical protein